MSQRQEEAQQVISKADASLLEIIDHVLAKGVVITGEVMLGVAGVDLIYLRVSAILCAADRVKEGGAHSAARETP